MKIGLLTYHRAVNDGAIMQLYCLQRLLSERLPGARVEVVDYRPPTLEWIERRRYITRRFPFLNTRHVQKTRDVRRFVRTRLPVSPTACTTSDLAEARAFVEAQGYDAVVVGSDTVWEMRPPKNVPPAPNLYFLPEVAVARKASFAASADPVDFDAAFLYESNRVARIRRALMNFGFITVRDAATAEQLERVGVTAPVHYLPDPTLLYDLGDVVRVPAGLKRPGCPLAGVAVSSDVVRREATRQLRARGYDVLNLLGLPVEGQRTLPKHLPLAERVGVHGALDLMITNRFHGSIFAMKLGNAPVVFCESAAKWSLPNSKGRDLLTRLGAEAAVWRWTGQEEDAIPDLVERGRAAWAGVEEAPQEALHGLASGAQQTLEALVAHLRSGSSSSPARTGTAAPRASASKGQS